MTTLTLELTDEQAQTWEAEAQRLHMTPEQLATQSVEERLSGRKRYVTQTIRRIIKENAELYRRLAQVVLRCRQEPQIGNPRLHRQI